MSLSLISIPQKLEFNHSVYLFGLISIGLLATLLSLLRNQNLPSTIINLSIFSVLITVCYLLMDAPDVAMTEAALSAALSVVIFLNFGRNINLTAQKKPVVSLARLAGYIIILGVVGSLLVFLGYSLVDYGSEALPLHTHVNQYYLQNTMREIGTPNFVSALLASYRGFDTLGETMVIFIAGIAVLLLLDNKDDS